MEELDVFKTENLALKRENARLHKVIAYMTEALVNSYHAKTVRCHEDKINSITRYLIEQAVGNIEVKMVGKGSSIDTQYGTTYQNINIDNDGNFTIKWNMTSGVVVGNGTVVGKVNHEYKPNSDGTISVTVKNIVINKVEYKYTGNNGLASVFNASYKINGLNNDVIFNKPYDVRKSWIENVNKTVTYNKTLTIKPKDKAELELFDTIDTWTLAPTVARATIQYINNNSSLSFNNSPCETCGDITKEQSKPVEEATSTSVITSESIQSSVSVTNSEAISDGSDGDKEGLINSITSITSTSESVSSASSNIDSSESEQNVSSAPEEPGVVTSS